MNFIIVRLQKMGKDIPVLNVKRKEHCQNLKNLKIQGNGLEKEENHIKMGKKNVVNAKFIKV